MKENAVPVAHRVHERLRPIRWPQFFVIEDCGIPHDFIHKLWQLHGVRGRTWAAALERARAGVCDVLFMIRAVEIFAIPASVLSLVTESIKLAV